MPGIPFKQYCLSRHAIAVLSPVLCFATGVACAVLQLPSEDADDDRLSVLLTSSLITAASAAESILLPLLTRLLRLWLLAALSMPLGSVAGPDIAVQAALLLEAATRRLLALTVVWLQPGLASCLLSLLGAGLHTAQRSLAVTAGSKAHAG